MDFQFILWIYYQLWTQYANRLFKSAYYKSKSPNFQKLLCQSPPTRKCKLQGSFSIKTNIFLYLLHFKLTAVATCMWRDRTASTASQTKIVRIFKNASARNQVNFAFFFKIAFSTTLSCSNNSDLRLAMAAPFFVGAFVIAAALRFLFINEESNISCYHTWI